MEVRRLVGIRYFNTEHVLLEDWEIPLGTQGLLLTVILGLYFIILQSYQYIGAAFTIADAA